MAGRVAGKVALVTGGAMGLGKADCEALAREGAKVIVTDREVELAHKVAAEIGGDAMALDVTSEEQWIEVMRAVKERHGGLDILVNNAGVASHGETETFDDARLAQVMDTNFTALFRCCREAIPAMRRRGGGAIVNIGSISAMISNVPQDQSVYNASKAAVHMLSQSLGSELAKYNIRVNTIAPGYIETEMTAGGLANPDWAPVWDEMTPMRRVAKPEEIATIALMLATEASSYMTGSVVVADGGYTTR